MLRALSAILLVLALVTGAGAERLPTNEALIRSKQTALAGQCPDLTVTESFLQEVDFNGDGLGDVLAHYGGLICNGSALVFCAGGGCLMEIYLRDAGGGLKQAGKMVAHGFYFDRPHPESPSFLAFHHYSVCENSSSEPCICRYEIRNDKVIFVADVTFVEEEFPDDR